jgi:hypothetical protein
MTPPHLATDYPIDSATPISHLHFGACPTVFPFKVVWAALLFSPPWKGTDTSKDASFSPQFVHATYTTEDGIGYPSPLRAAILTVPPTWEGLPLVIPEKSGAGSCFQAFLGSNSEGRRGVSTTSRDAPREQELSQGQLVPPIGLW